MRRPYLPPMLTTMSAWGPRLDAPSPDQPLAQRMILNNVFTHDLLGRQVSARDWRDSHMSIPQHNGRVMSGVFRYCRTRLKESASFVGSTFDALMSVHDRSAPRHRRGVHGNAPIDLLFSHLVEAEVIELTLGDKGGFDGVVLSNYLKGKRVIDGDVRGNAKVILHAVKYRGADTPIDFQLVGNISRIQREIFLQWFESDAFVQARRELSAIARKTKVEKAVAKALKHKETSVAPRRLMVWNEMSERRIGSDASTADVYIGDDSVAGHQASVFMLHDTWYLQNAAKAKKTFYWEGGRWKAAPRGSMVPIEPGDIVRVGSTLLEVARADLDIQTINEIIGIEFEPDSDFLHAFAEMFATSKDTAQGREKLLTAIADNLTGSLHKRIIDDREFRRAVFSLRERVNEDMQLGRTAFDPRFGALAPRSFTLPESFKSAFKNLYENGLMKLLYLTDRHGGMSSNDTTVERTLMAIYDDLIGYRDGADDDMMWEQGTEEAFRDHLLKHANVPSKLSWEKGGFIFGRNKAGAFVRPPEGRIYLPVRVGCVEQLWAQLAGLAGGTYRSTPLTWKVDTDLERYRTGDPMLIYFLPEHSEHVYRLTVELFTAHPEWFQDTSLLLGAKLKMPGTADHPNGVTMKGISFAQSDNRSDHSFNREIGAILMHPTRGIRLRLALGETTSYEEVMRTTAYTLWMNGISLEHPAFRGAEGLQAFRYIADRSDQAPAPAQP